MGSVYYRLKVLFVDFYKLLGIADGATDAEIKRSFREMAKIYHPDINKSADAGDNFRMLYVAYDTLSDPFKRKMYDDLRRNDFLQTENFWNKAYYEKMQRRSDMRARGFAEMEFEKFEESVFSKVGFHAKQILAFLIFFTMLCGGMACLIMGFHFVFYENFNGAQVSGYGLWAGAFILCYISGKALLDIYEIWRQ